MPKTSLAVPLALCVSAPPGAAPVAPAPRGAAVEISQPPDSTAFVHPDSLPLFRTYDRRYLREDTLAVPFVYRWRDDVESGADRVTLEEILRRCIDAERHAFAGITDAQYTTTERAVLYYGDPDDVETRRVVHEEIARVYRQTPDRVCTVTLSTREHDERTRDGERVRKEKRREVAVRAETAREELWDLPFFFENLSDYRFTIEEREDFEDRVLYRVTFRPRTDFDPLPEGEFWIDTTDFRIFHTSMRWRKNVPIPLVLRSVDHVAIEMQRVAARWVPARLSARVRLRKIPLLPIPEIVEAVVTFEDYAIDAGLPAGIFPE